MSKNKDHQAHRKNQPQGSSAESVSPVAAEQSAQALSESISPAAAKQSAQALAESVSPTAAELNAQEKAARREKLHKRHMRALRDLIIRTISFALVIYILFFHLVGITIMPTADMYPRIDHGDLVLFYRLEQSIHAQDVIVFKKPTDSLEQSYEHEDVTETARPEKTALRKALDWIGFADPADPPMTTFICRVVAGPGDTVEIGEGDRLIVNGNTMIETNIFYSTPEYAGFVEYPLTLGEKQYFVLADSRNGGADSRFFGAVNEEEILGTVITILRRNNL